MFDPLKTFESKNIIVWCRIIKTLEWALRSLE